MTAVILISIFAAFVNGGLGYGFSSLTVPIALLYYSSRVLNPALVLIEVGVNFYTLILNRKRLRGVWPRVRPLLFGLLPAIIIGSNWMMRVEPSTIKIICYSVLAPLILLQAFGWRRPLKTESAVGAGLGGLIGLLYSTTTISGPPLALLLNNEGFEKQDFRAAIGTIRVFESVMTAITYFALGFFTSESMEVLKWIAPGALIAMPLGAVLLGKVEAQTFRRVCISLDVWLIAYGLSRVLPGVAWFPRPAIWALFLTIVAIDAFGLVRFFVRRRQSNVISISEAIAARDTPDLGKGIRKSA